MRIISYLFIAILSGILALLCAGIVTNFYVRWYKISSFEGKSGYFIVGMAIFGGLAGIIIGLIATRIVSNGASVGFLKGLGLSWAIIIGLSLLAFLVSWLMADIPPKIDGEELDLLVEYRFPAGKEKLPEISKDTYLALGSLSNKTVRKKQHGELDIEAARKEDGHWILPGSVFIFTTRGKRLLYIVFNDEITVGFLLPLPRRPGQEFEKWSDWIPHPMQEDPQWQGKSYRFRVQREGKFEKENEIQITSSPDLQIKFSEPDPDASIMDWLEYASSCNQSDERFIKAINVIETRQNDLAKAILSRDKLKRESALAITAKLIHIKPVTSKSVLTEGSNIEELIRRFNKMTQEDPENFTLTAEILSRFSHWNKAWWNIHRRTKIDGRQPVKNILDLARIRAKKTSMDEVVLNARAHINGIPDTRDDRDI